MKKKYTYYIGVDVSKKTIDICLIHQKKSIFSIQVANNTKGFKDFVKACKPHRIPIKKALVCLENTGDYGNPFALWATKNNYNVWIENATAIKNSKGFIRGESDKIDAYHIALYASRFEDKCRLWTPPRNVVTMLRNLRTTRDRLINVRKILRTPLKESVGFCSKDVQKKTEGACANSLKSIDKDIKEIDKKIAELMKGDPPLSRQKAIITSTTGMGDQCAVALLVFTNEFKNVSSAQALACHAGAAPFSYSSGTSVRGRTRVSPSANMTLKWIIHMAALSAIQNCPEMRAYYERKVAEGKPKMSVINAVRSKLLLRVWACIRDDRMYEENYTRKVA